MKRKAATWSCSKYYIFSKKFLENTSEQSPFQVATLLKLNSSAGQFYPKFGKLFTIFLSLLGDTFSSSISRWLLS